MSQGQDDDVWLDESFFVDESYLLKSFNYGSKTIAIRCLQSSSTDYDLTGQIVWPGAELLNKCIVEGFLPLESLSLLELGSGVGLTGILCAHYCQKVVMTDHNSRVLEVLQSNIELQNTELSTALMSCELLEWGNDEQMKRILEKHPQGFDVIIGADICYQQDSISLLVKTVSFLLSHKKSPSKRFILSYISRAKSIYATLMREVASHALHMHEIEGTRTQLVHHGLEGALYELTSATTTTV